MTKSRAKPLARVLGVDGYKKGWVTVLLEDGRFVAAGVARDFAELMERRAAGVTIIGVDMPVGLLPKGARDADQSARDSLSGSASSVFSVPPRPVVALADWDRALARAKELSTTGKGITKQAFNLFPKIREVDAFIGDPRVREVHPEVSFRRLADQHPGIAKAAEIGPKKSWRGQRQRLDLLSAAGIVLPSELGEADHVPPDDVLDAAIVAWSACRIAAGDAVCYPPEPVQRDRSDRLIMIEA